MPIADDVRIEDIRQMIHGKKAFNEIMTDIMNIGKKIVDNIGHKNYKSFEEAMKDIESKTSPLCYIDQDVITNFESGGINLIGVKKCPFKDIMQQMSQSETDDAKVDTIMQGFQVGEGIEGEFLDIGCYIAQQIRQMIVSSLSINGEYLINYIHLGCNRKNIQKIINAEVKATEIDEGLLNRLLKEVDCVYALSFKEGQEEEV